MSAPPVRGSQRLAARLKTYKVALFDLVAAAWAEGRPVSEAAARQVYALVATLGAGSDGPHGRSRHAPRSVHARNTARLLARALAPAPKSPRQAKRAARNPGP